MDDGLNRLLLKDAVQSRLVQQVCLIENRADSGDLFDAVENLRLRVGKVIDDDDLTACLNQFDDGVTANKSGASGD